MKQTSKCKTNKVSGAVQQCNWVILRFTAQPSPITCLPFILLHVIHFEKNNVFCDFSRFCSECVQTVTSAAQCDISAPTLPLSSCISEGGCEMNKKNHVWVLRLHFRGNNITKWQAYPFGKRSEWAGQQHTGRAQTGDFLKTWFGWAFRAAAVLYFQFKCSSASDPLGAPCLSSRRRVAWLMGSTVGLWERGRGRGQRHCIRTKCKWEGWMNRMKVIVKVKKIWLCSLLINGKSITGFKCNLLHLLLKW